MNDGGHVFPTGDFSESGFSYQHPGMSLRDYFAAAAMNGLVSNNIADRLISNPYDYLPMCYAKAAYSIADAMLAAREKKPD